MLGFLILNIVLGIIFVGTFISWAQEVNNKLGYEYKHAVYIAVGTIFLLTFSSFTLLIIGLMCMLVGSNVLSTNGFIVYLIVNTICLSAFSSRFISHKERAKTCSPSQH